MLALPLTNILKKDKAFNFGLVEKDAFTSLTERLCCDPVLALYDTKAETEIHADAYKNGLGAILIQKNIQDQQIVCMRA